MHACAAAVSWASPPPFCTREYYLGHIGRPYYRSTRACGLLGIHPKQNELLSAACLDDYAPRFLRLVGLPLPRATAAAAGKEPAAGAGRAGVTAAALQQARPLRAGVRRARGLRLPGAADEPLCAEPLTHRTPWALEGHRGAVLSRPRTAFLRGGPKKSKQHPLRGCLRATSPTHPSAPDPLCFRPAHLRRPLYTLPSLGPILSRGTPHVLLMT